MRATHTTGIRLQATAQVVCILHQTMSDVAFEVVPELLGGIEFRSICRERFQTQAGVGLAYGLNSRSAMDGTMIPQDDDVAP